MLRYAEIVLLIEFSTHLEILIMIHVYDQE